MQRVVRNESTAVCRHQDDLAINGERGRIITAEEHLYRWDIVVKIVEGGSSSRRRSESVSSPEYFVP